MRVRHVPPDGQVQGYKWAIRARKVRSSSEDITSLNYSHDPDRACSHAAGSAMRSHVTCVRAGWRVSVPSLRLERRLVGTAAAAEFGHAALLSA